MPLIRNADIKPYDLMGNRMRGLSTPRRGPQEIAVWHGKMIEPGRPLRRTPTITRKSSSSSRDGAAPPSTEQESMSLRGMS
jgi:hypothetical protein